MTAGDADLCTRAETPAALREPRPQRQDVVGPAKPVACRPSCLLYGGCFTCAPEEYDEEQGLALGSEAHVGEELDQ